MSEPVVIKSSRYGLNLFLDAELPFPELAVAVEKKFEESARFFKNAKVAVSFEGRELSREELFALLDAITANTDITILCIVDNEESHADRWRAQIDAYYDALTGKGADFYKGVLLSGQKLESDTGIVFIGDVREGARLTAAGSIIVLGNLSGSAHAGTGGKADCFISALSMSPEKLAIGSVTKRSGLPQEKEKKRLRKEKEAVPVTPKIAFERDGAIRITDLPRTVLQ